MNTIKSIRSIKITQQNNYSNILNGHSASRCNYVQLQHCDIENITNIMICNT